MCSRIHSSWQLQSCLYTPLSYLIHLIFPVVESYNLVKVKLLMFIQVIDGHVVTVNETTYSSGDDNMGAVFRIKVVEVLPSETPEGEGDSEAKPDTEAQPDAEAKPAPEPTTGESEMDTDKHEETNEIPNQKVGSEVDDLNA